MPTVTERAQALLYQGEELAAFLRWHRAQLGGLPHEGLSETLLRFRIDQWRRSLTGEPTPPLELDAAAPAERLTAGSLRREVAFRYHDGEIALHGEEF